MGAMGAIAPTAKKLWGRGDQWERPPQMNFVISPLYTVKWPMGTVKITNVSL